MVNIIILATFDNDGDAFFYISLMILGFFINGFTNIIYVTCCTDMGKELDLIHKQPTLSKICCIIEGLGALGSALGIFVIGESLEAYPDTDCTFKYRWPFWAPVTFTIGICLIPLVWIVVGETKDVLIIFRNRKKIL